MFEPSIEAPDFAGIKAWINSKPLKIEDLRGKVVLVDFWSYTCINCQRTLPYLKKWHEKYAKDGLVIIGVHSPEFGFEKDVENVKKAVKELGIEYAVAVDSDMKTWDEYSNRYWPAKYLVNKDGYVAYLQFGEGAYGQTEAAIQGQLGIKKALGKEEYPDYLFDQSPETYTGFLKNLGLGSGLACDKDGCNVYIDSGDHEMDVIYPHGQWSQEKDYLELKKSPGILFYRFNAREVNMVVEPLEKAEAEIFVDGKKADKIRMDEPRMYNVFKDKKYGDRELSVTFNGKVRVYVYTFG